MDLVGFVDGMPDGNYAISDKAALYCINRVNEEMVARLGTSVPRSLSSLLCGTETMSVQISTG